MEFIDSLSALARAHRRRTGRPFVTLSYAQSIDGCISARGGESLALSGSESLRMTHSLRAFHDMILVGIGTVLSDDPQLTVREVDGQDPRPVILDSRLRTPTTARLLRNGSTPIIATRTDPDAERVARLEDHGARVVVLPCNERGQVSIPALLDELGNMEVDAIMVEGGQRVITSFLLGRLADFAVLTVSPVFVGGFRAVSDLGQSDPTCFVRVKEPRHLRLGEDLVVFGDLI